VGKKPEIIMTGRKKQSISISLDNTELKQVLEFKHLGTTFTENWRIDREIEIRCNEANQVLGQQSSILQHNAVTIKTKKKS
jgi:hypothetical protein